MPTFILTIDKGDDTASHKLPSPASVTIDVYTTKDKPRQRYQLALGDEGLILEEITWAGEFGETLATIPYDEHTDHQEET